MLKHAIAVAAALALLSCAGPSTTERKGLPELRTVPSVDIHKATNAKLEVSFFGPFWGDYWVIDLAPDYSYAVVGHPSRDYLWILGRTPSLPKATLEGIQSRLLEQGYDLSRLQWTVQPGATQS